MINDLFVLAVALFMVVKGATLATKYAAMLAEGYRLSKYTIGFVIVAVISILPETFISLDAAFEGIPAFGLGVLFGSNTADLTLIFAIITLVAGRGLKVESPILSNRKAYPFLLFLPVVLGLDGNFSRLEGAALIIAGAVFYYLALRNGIDGMLPKHDGKDKYKNTLMLLLGMAVLLIGSHFTVISATSLASSIGVNPILIGMFVVGIGTTMPELFFSLKAVKRRDDSLAIGDILGTVLADATIVVGILALVSPFSFPQKLIFVTAMFMVGASFMLFRLMNSGRTLSRRETYMLLFFWVAFVLVEFIVNK